MNSYTRTRTNRTYTPEPLNLPDWAKTVLESDDPVYRDPTPDELEIRQLTRLMGYLNYLYHEGTC